MCLFNGGVMVIERKRILRKKKWSDVVVPESGQSCF